MVTTRQGAADLHAAADDGRLEALCHAHDVGLLVLFGSAASDGEGTPSDLDVAVLPRTPSAFDPVAFHTALVDLLHIDRIDLLDLSSAGWLARSQALGEGIPLYEDQPGTYAAAQLRAVPLAMELGWLTDLDLALLGRPVTPRRLDPPSVTARLRLMADALDDLQLLGPVDVDRLRDDRLARRVVERCLAHLVDTASAINAHLVGAVTGRAPRDLADSFDQAVVAGVLDADLGGRLRHSAGMRNVIVHAYDELDLTRVAAAVALATADFERYITAVARFVQARGEESG